MSDQEQDLTNKQQAIVDAASRLIIEKGVGNTSLADIANAVGISKGTLYYYYPSKSSLIFDVTEQHFNQITQGLFDWIEVVKQESDPEKILHVVFETILQAKTRGRLHLYLIQSVTSNNEVLQTRFRQKYQEWQTMIEIGIVQVLGDYEEYKPLAALILATLDGFIIQTLLGLEPSLDEVIDYLAKRY